MSVSTSNVLNVRFICLLNLPIYNRPLIDVCTQWRIGTEELRIESVCRHQTVNHVGTSSKFWIQFILNNPIRESPRRYPVAGNFGFASSWTKCRCSLSCLLLRLTLWHDSTTWKSHCLVRVTSTLIHLM